MSKSTVECIYMDYTNYNPRNIDSSSQFLPEFEFSQYNRKKYSSLCASDKVWDHYSLAEQSCLAYTYDERVKVSKNTDQKFYIVHDFNNFQRYFLGTGARLWRK